MNAETAADLAQDTFLRVLSSPPANGVLNHNPRAYLFQVSRNLGINYQRRQALVPMVDIDDELAAEIPDETPSPETIVHSRVPETGRGGAEQAP